MVQNDLRQIKAGILVTPKEEVRAKKPKHADNMD